MKLKIGMKIWAKYIQILALHEPLMKEGAPVKAGATTADCLCWASPSWLSYQLTFPHFQFLINFEKRMQNYKRMRVQHFQIKPLSKMKVQQLHKITPSAQIGPRPLSLCIIRGLESNNFWLFSFHSSFQCIYRGSKSRRLRKDVLMSPIGKQYHDFLCLFYLCIYLSCGIYPQ